MNTDPTSLDRLHDIILPTAVSWWPLAPGWYVLIVTMLLIVILIAYRFWKRRQANAYRRHALQELTRMNDNSAIAELLRRTALAAVPRSEVADKTGPDWADWLAGHCPIPMVSKVHQLLATEIYNISSKEQDFRILRDYAVCWITRHSTSFLHVREKYGE